MIVRVILPEFVRVTVCAALVEFISWPEKVRLVGVRLAPGSVPVPLRGTFCGLPAASSVIVIVAVRVPTAVGWKMADIMQLAAGPSVAGSVPQVSVSPKSPAFVPVTLIPATVIVARLMLVSVMVWALLAVLTS